MATKVKGEAPPKQQHASDLLSDLIGAGSLARRQQEPGGAESLQVRLDGDCLAPQRARRAVETLGDRLDARAVGDLRAVVSELVAICLAAPEHPIEVRIELQGGRVCGEVRRLGGASEAIGGSGQALRIIGALVEEWGITPGPAVWFRIAGAN